MKKLVPKRRFEEFKDSEAWEQRKVKDMFKVTRGYVLAATKTTREKTPSAPYPVYSSQTSNQGLMGYYKDYLYKDAITWTTDGANAGTVNYREGKFYCTNVCGVLISEEGYANKMVSEVLNMIAWKHVSKVGNPKLMNNVMSEIIISIPNNMEEQKKISNFVSNLDNLITLHQRKLKKLKNLKSAYLSEMFPKDGELYPKRRFAGFTDPWEQRKVKDMFKVTRGYVLAATKTTREKTPSAPYPVYSSQTSNQGLMGYYKDYLYKDAITWTTDGANAGTVNYREGKFYCTNVCGVLISEEGYANKMVSEVLNMIAWKHVSSLAP